LRLAGTAGGYSTIIAFCRSPILFLIAISIFSVNRDISFWSLDALSYISRGYSLRLRTCFLLKVSATVSR
jgi:hypothetical protein